MDIIKADLRPLLNLPPEIILSNQEFLIIINTISSESKLNSYSKHIPTEIINIMYQYYPKNWCLYDPRFKWKYTNNNNNSINISEWDQYHFLYVFGLAIDYINGHRKTSPVYDKKLILRYLVTINFDSSTFMGMEKRDYCNLFRNATCDYKIRIPYGSMCKLRTFIMKFNIDNIENGTECIISIIHQCKLRRDYLDTVTEQCTDDWTDE